MTRLPYPTGWRVTGRWPEYAHAREAKLVSMLRNLTAGQAAALSIWGLTALQALALSTSQPPCDWGTGTSLERRDRPD
jgi:NADPH:quinone reductase-like Zn-dependent oxidoreductase